MNNNKTRGISGLSILLCVLVLAGVYWFMSQSGVQQTAYTYQDFQKDLKKEKVESVEVKQNKVAPTGTLKIRLKNDDIEQLHVSDVNSAEDLLESYDISYSVDNVPQDSWMSTTLVPIILMAGIMVFVVMMMNRQGGSNAKAMNFGKSRAKMSTQEENHVTFAQVAGLQEEKEELAEIVDFLKSPGKYTQVGARIPKGVLLEGPPGTGKTLLARAIAGEAGVPFFTISGSDFVEMFVGVGASRVRDLFKEAEKNAPCIIFIDEIDAIGRSRDSKYGGGNEEREQTLNQLLSEMDGFDGKKGIIVLAATNRPEILDKALLRPGRFDRRVIVDKPDLKGRVDILKVHAKDVLMDETVDLDAIALATSGAVGSDLANMINEAAINAVKEGREFVSQKDLFNAVEVVLVGKEKKDRIMSKEERKIVSYHEVGHALISALQKNSEPVQKITIVPRTMGALGYVMHVPEDEKYLNTQAELHDMIVGLLGGRAAEEIVFDTVTTGASNDIEKATSIARSMVTRYGMSKKFGLMGLETVESQYLDGRSSLNCADNTASEIDNEVMQILKDAYEEALQMLRENRDVLDKIAAHLIEKETITGKEFMKIYREAKGLPEPEENKEEKKEENKEEKPQETAIEQEAPKQTVVEEDDEKAPTPEELRSRPTQQAVNPYLPRNEISFAPRQPQQQESMPQQPMQGDNTTEQQSAGNQSGTDTDKENSQFSSRWNQ